MNKRALLAPSAVVVACGAIALVVCFSSLTPSAVASPRRRRGFNQRGHVHRHTLFHQQGA
jgi:hypothetical protein